MREVMRLIGTSLALGVVRVKTTSRPFTLS